jgi:hypothetical protein
MGKANFTGAKAPGLIAKGTDLHKVIASPDFLNAVTKGD